MSIYKLSGPKIFFILFLISLILYSNSLNGEFIFDDKLVIVDNELIKHIRTIPLLFTTQVFNQTANFFLYEGGYKYYRPLMTLSFAIDYSIWRLNSVGYHLTNILVHSLNAFLVFLLIYGLFINMPLALLTSILFCVHPMHTQTVSYITNRSELLVSLFTLLTLVSYLKFAKTKSLTVYVISLISFICALLSREAAFLIFVPFVVILIGMRSEFPRINIILNFIAFAGVLAIYVFMRLTVLVPLQLFPVSQLPFLFDVLNFLRVLMEYSKLLIFPYQFYILRNIAPIMSIELMQIIPVSIFLLFLIIIITILIKQKKYILLFGVSWFIGTLFYLIRFMYKVSGVISIEEQWVYLASIGFFVILAYLILSIKRPKLIAILTAFFIIVYGALTFFNNSHWKDEINFYRYNLRFNRYDAGIVMRINLISALCEKGYYDEALKEADFIISVSPENWMAYIMLGDTLRLMKRYPEAEQAYKKALRIDYFCWQANLRLKSLAEQRGVPYQEDIDPKLSPEEARIVSFIREGNFRQALGELVKALKASPTSRTYTIAGVTFAKMGLYNQAIEAFNDALKLDDQNLAALNNLLVIYKRLGRFKEAALTQKMFEQTIELKKGKK